MSDIKNDNIEEIVESEEQLAVALSEEALEATSDNGETVMIEYFDKDGGISGLTDKQRRRKEIWDKVTTGILIFLMSSPILIVGYILLWFFLR
ncbi:MAG: hypothetical protein E7673_01230 [Ruminococcaceae bacterium]|nr:hypothetical protein [Oscillospiraceae bacterium]